MERMPGPREREPLYTGNIFDTIQKIAARLRRAVVPDREKYDDDAVLPWNVRQRFQASGILNKSEISAMVGDRRWEDAASYLVAKSLDNDPAAQEEYLRALMDAFRTQQDAHPILEQYCDRLSDDTEVIGSKLLQISRVGPKFWNSQIRKMAEQMRSDGATPCLVAYSILSGLREFVQTAEDGEQFLIVIKHRVENDRDHALFLVTCEADGCTVEEWTSAHNTQGIREVHLCDDTVRSGKTLEQTRQCLLAKADFMPHIGEKTYSVVDVSNIPK